MDFFHRIGLLFSVVLQNRNKYCIFFLFSRDFDLYAVKKIHSLLLCFVDDLCIDHCGLDV